MKPARMARSGGAAGAAGRARCQARGRAPERSQAPATAGQRSEQMIRSAATTWRAPATAPPATRARGGEPYAGGLGMATPFGALFTPQHHARPRDRHRQLDRRRLLARAARRAARKDGALLYPAFPYPNYTQVTRDDADAIYRVPEVDGAGAAAEPAARTALPVQPARAARRLARAVLQARRVRARPDASAPNGTAAPTWCRAWATATPATPRATCSARQPGPTTFAGGLIPMQNWYAPSLTSSREAGLGDWEVEEIVDAAAAPACRRAARSRADGARWCSTACST